MDFNVVMKSLQKTLELGKQDLEMMYKYDDNEGAAFTKNQIDYIQSITNFLSEYEKLSKKEKPEKPVYSDKKDWFLGGECPNCKNSIYRSRKYIQPTRCVECGQIFDWSDWNE